MCIGRVLRPALALAGLILVVSLATPALAQELPFTETFDDPTLSRWEHPPNATVIDGVLRIEPAAFAFHPARWGDISLAVRVRRLGEGELLIRYRFALTASRFRDSFSARPRTWAPRQHPSLPASGWR
jgi:hypothetical protein